VSTKTTQNFFQNLSSSLFIATKFIHTLSLLFKRARVYTHAHIRSLFSFLFSSGIVLGDSSFLLLLLLFHEEEEEVVGGGGQVSSQ
jgi:hypothetical protein